MIIVSFTMLRSAAVYVLIYGIIVTAGNLFGSLIKKWVIKKSLFTGQDKFSEVHFIIEENKEIVVIDETTIKIKIYYLRNQKVMLDFELAEIYGYTTTRFNEQVRNNAEKFDDDFMFQLTKSEFENLISKKSTSSWGGRRKLPYAFTEQGIYMLMAVLRG